MKIFWQVWTLQHELASAALTQIKRFFYRVSFLSWNIKISQERRIVGKNFRNKNFLLSRGKSDSEKIYPTPWEGSFDITNENLYFQL